MLDIISALEPEGSPERCGFILNDDTIVELDNVHPEPVRGFIMDASQLLSHVENAKASWHTHPGGDPNLSEEDRNGFLQWPKLVHHIVGVRAGVPTVVTFKVINGFVVSE